MSYSNTHIRHRLTRSNDVLAVVSKYPGHTLDWYRRRSVHGRLHTSHVKRAFQYVIAYGFIRSETRSNHRTVYVPVGSPRSAIVV